MATRPVDAQIAAQARLRQIVATAVQHIWTGLPGYDEANVDQWLTQAVPVVEAAQHQSVSLTEAFLGYELGRAVVGIPPAGLVGAAVRAGALPEEVYRRPFVTVWSALKAGREFEDAVHSGLVRATSTAQMDVQLSQRATLQAVQESTPGVYGYQRVADPGACEFCMAVNGAYVKRADAMALHNRCGCSLVPLRVPHPHARFLPDGTDVTDQYAVREHGELGLVLTAPGDHFTTEHELH